MLVGAWAALAGLLIVCGELIVRAPAVASFDRRITTFVVDHRTPALDHVMKVVTWTGSWIAALAVAVAVAVLVLGRRLPVTAVAVVLAAWMGELLAVTLTKSVVQRDRPPEAVWLVVAHGWSFPSGHSANAVVVFATAAALATLFVHQAGLRALIWVGAALAAGVVGFSRIELGVHWTTDVLASFVWTGAWILVVVAIHRRLRASGPAVSGRPGVLSDFR